MAGGDFSCDLLAVGDVGDHHARAFRSQRLRIVPADALGAAGDDRGFSFKSCHDRLQFVMAGLVPAIHAFIVAIMQDVDARNKCGHDDKGKRSCRVTPPTAWPSAR